ncbi:glycosyltransferase [Hyphomicrobium sp.]|jgi:glycosyltransferase involved in cell wall biosynthesis|uniref:glycosyltransferase n=1 Tax=Hyphomicrobium sp. TaxID=82 RepID=UPI0035650812
MTFQQIAEKIPLTRAALWTPDYQVQSAWFEHAPFAFWLMDVLRPKTFVELGTHSGFSYFCFCQAVERLHIPTSCCAIDTWKGDEHSALYGEEVFEAVKHHNMIFTNFSRLVRSKFSDALSEFADKSIDLLHIDGRHFYEDVREDFESWRAKLTDDAVVLFHDTNVRERNFGVWKFFDDIKANHATFEFVHGYGLGIVAAKNPPVALQSLFTSDAKTAEDWRLIFSTLGAQVTREWQSQEYKSRLLLQDLELARTREKLDRVLGQIDRMTEEKAKVTRALSRRAFQLRKGAPNLKRLSLKIQSRLLPKQFKENAINSSIFFDPDWYRTTYPDVAASRVDPAKHYIEYGATEGRDPGPFFSTQGYMINNPDVKRRNVNPLLHFERRGWIDRREVFTRLEIGLTASARHAIANHLADLDLKPLISVVMPVYNTPESFLREAIDSVIRQCYPNWELCIANDASPSPLIAPLLNEFVKADSRIKVVHREKNGHISEATNSALKLASGEFIALMDHDDVLNETALYEVAVAINASPSVDIIYSDEDSIDENGRIHGGYCKTDFNPELLLGQNMVSHLGVYRRSLMDKIGGFRKGFEGSQDYDLILRAWAQTTARKICHIPSFLYHWRRGSIAPSFSEAQLEKCTTAARKAIQEYLDIEGEDARVTAAPGAENFSRVIRRVPSPKPLVSIIIPTKDCHHLLSTAVDGVLNGTNYPNIEVIIVDHDSEEKKTISLFEKLKRDSRVRIIRHSGLFNYSAMNNAAVREAKGSIIALLNNDIEIIGADWLNEMVSHAIRREIGAVGAKLLYPDGRIQHAGVVIGLGDFAGHAFHFAPKRELGYMGQAVLTRAVSAVTGACLVVRKSIYEEVGGLDEQELPVAFNDVDFCLKVQERGYRNVWTPFAELIHHESVTRGAESTPEKRERFRRDCEFMRKKWPDVFANDPFYNLNLALNSSNYEKARYSRRLKPWSRYLKEDESTS